MSRIFSFERELYATLELMPLALRRKLDLAGLKLSLRGWQAMPEADRRALVEAEVGDEASVAAFAAALRGAAGRAGTALEALDTPSPPWRSAVVPASLGARLAEIGASLGDAGWSALDDEARYALLHLARRGSDEHRARLRAALDELGLGAPRHDGGDPRP